MCVHIYIYFFPVLLLLCSLHLGWFHQYALWNVFTVHYHSQKNTKGKVCVYIYTYIYIYINNQPKSEKRNRDLILFLTIIFVKHVLFSYGWLLQAALSLFHFLKFIHCSHRNVDSYLLDISQSGGGIIARIILVMIGFRDRFPTTWLIC